MQHKTLRQYPSYVPAVFALTLFVVVFTGMSVAGTETILHGFSIFPHGFQPNGGLIPDAAGNLYGTTFQGGRHLFGAVYELSPNSKGGWTETILYSFTGGADGNVPAGSLVFDKSGNLYGATIGGGSTQSGTIFELTPHTNGQWKEKVLWNFHGEDGFTPNGGLIFDAAGNLYGTTFSGGGVGQRTCGQGGCGTVFRLSPQANGRWAQTILYRFQGKSDGANPNGSLVLGGAGNLFGTTVRGGDIVGNLGYGVLFEVSQTSSGWEERSLYQFTDGTDGSSPSALIADSVGNLYGEAANGGSSTGCAGSPCGLVFEFSLAKGGQWTETVLYNFNGSDGVGPGGGLIFGPAGELYGTTGGGGTNSRGTVFQISQGSSGQWSEKVLWDFTGGNDGWWPFFGVILGSAGQVFTTAAYGGGLTGNGTVVELTPSQNGVWKETTLTNFPDGSGDVPLASVTFDTAGNLYGTNSRSGEYAAGSIYELTPNGKGGWTETVLYDFPAGHGIVTPSSLVFDAAGNLYGETEYGGTAGLGSIFELSLVAGTWTEKDLYSFSGGNDGANPQGGLIFDQAGNLYGTTQKGGSACQRNGCGTAFELSSSGGGWTKSVLYNFSGGTTDGEYPVAALVFDAKGNLYGTTLGGGPSGGNNNCGIGCGAVFELSPAGQKWNESVLYFFTEKHGDGAIPYGSLVVDAAGNLHGTTSTGGQQSEACGIGCGTVFEISPVSGGWKETVLYQFPQFFGPLAGLVFDLQGNLFGTNSGSVFELSPASGGGWNESTVYTFGVGNGDANYPEASLIVDQAGNLYGTTAGGGSAGGGTVFEITP